MRRAPRYLPAEYRSRPRDLELGLFDDILDRVRNGELLTDICDDQDMPLPGTFLGWLREDPKLRQQYEQAQETGTEVMFDQVVSDAHSADPSIARVRSEALRWHVERAQPDRYGPRAIIKTPKDDDPQPGIDYTGELRRRIEEMAARQRATAEESAA